MGSNLASEKGSLSRRVVRWGLNLLYTRFAFAYDAVSTIVSRGEWHDWTRAAIPFLVGSRILEVAFGTGNLHLDLYRAGYSPIGIDLSPNMHAVTREKFRREQDYPRLVRSRVQALPFASGYFSSLVMTFPPGFVYDLEAMRELWRVLEPRGALVWVDSPLIYPRDAWSRFLHWLFGYTGGCGNVESDEIGTLLRESHGGALGRMWKWRVEQVELKYSRVHVFVGTKNENAN